jgi:hypothetical protein
MDSIDRRDGERERPSTTGREGRPAKPKNRCGAPASLSGPVERPRWSAPPGFGLSKEKWPKKGGGQPNGGLNVVFGHQPYFQSKLFPLGHLLAILQHLFFLPSANFAIPSSLAIAVAPSPPSRRRPFQFPTFRSQKAAAAVHKIEKAENEIAAIAFSSCYFGAAETALFAFAFCCPFPSPFPSISSSASASRRCAADGKTCH